MELLLLEVEDGVVVPNRLGVGVVDDEVVESMALVGLVAMKENAGFGAAAEESVRGTNT